MEKSAIVGSGPAGLTAAIYSARADLFSLVFERPETGGHHTVSHEVENYPGLEQSLSGIELTDRFLNQYGVKLTLLVKMKTGNHL